jgi:hypothetical protein
MNMICNYSMYYSKDNYVKYPEHSLWRGSLGSPVQQSVLQTRVRSTSEKKVYTV